MQQPDDDWQRLEAEREMDELERAFGVLAPVLARSWRFGDGDGGGVIELMRRVVVDYDPSVLPSRPPTSSHRRQLSMATRTRIMERDGYRCKRCGTQKALSIDHIIAVVNGGSDQDDNLQTLCGPCNSSKGARE